MKTQREILEGNARRALRKEESRTQTAFTGPRTGTHSPELSLRWLGRGTYVISGRKAVHAFWLAVLISMFVLDLVIGEADDSSMLAWPP